MSKFIYIILFSLFFNTISLAENKVQDIEAMLSQSLSKELYNVSQNGRFIKVEIDRSLDQNYKDQLHKWINSLSKSNSNFERVHLTWKSDSIITSNISSISFLSTFLFLALFLFFSFKILTKKESEEDLELKIIKLVEQNVENTLLQKNKTSKLIKY